MTITVMGKELSIKKWQIIAVAVALIMVLAAIGTAINKSGGQVIIEGKGSVATEKEESTIKEDSEAAAMEEAAKENNAEEEIKVYVTGAVNSPGIVTLKKGQLIDDAVKAAGGFAPNADAENINLVYRLTENVTLKINPKNAVKTVPKANPPTQPIPPGREAGSGAELVKDSGVTILGDTQPEKSNSSNGYININRATAAELDTLPGIGPSYAEDIIAYREKNGPYKTIQDIMKVPGIKQNKFDKIKDRITVGG